MNKHLSKVKHLLISIFVLLFPSISYALIIDVPEYARGHYHSYGGHDGPWPMGSTFTYSDQRSYFVYDLSNIDLSLVDSLALSLYQIDGGLHTEPLPQFINVYDVTTSIEKLKIIRGTPSLYPEGLDIFNDLGTGDLYGTTSLVVPVPYRYEIALSNEAVNDLRDFFIVGVTVGPRAGAQFGHVGDAPISQANFLRLSLREESIPEPEESNAIPEPVTVVLFGSGLLGAFLRRKIG